ncbi:MAG TPA: ABC transporter ATP-binding protein [Chloroflexota bacterium]|nr:ABC transporter ATP-binding protein [Chloroflexota bacterium]
MAARPLAIRLENVSFRYAGRRLPTLQHLSLTVERGETLLVLGPSGCGKSTLALCLNGLIPHSIAGEMEGQVEVAGHDVAETPVSTLARSVGIVFQDPDSQFCMLRTDDEVAFGLENLAIPPAEMPARIERSLRTVGLGHVSRERIDRLSGGARQRLALACVLALDPSILIFDEPTSNLDPTGAADVFAEIARLKRSGDHTIVIVEHRLDQSVQLADRVLVLGPGGVPVAHGSPLDVFRGNADLLDEYGIWIPQVSELANQLRRHGLSVEPYPITLDQAAAGVARLIGPGLGAKHASPPALAVPTPDYERDPLAQSGMPPAVEICQLTYHYSRRKVALDAASLRIPDGSFFAIVGPNGAGKSTLASHLIGTIRPPRGTVRIFGRDIRELSERELTETVGYVFQNPEHQFVAQSVFDELAFGLRIRGLPEAEIRDRVEATLSEFGLASLGRANPFTLSLGEKRRLSVAAMLVLGQRILVLDEPTFGQDRKNTTALLAKLVKLNREGNTIIMITHDVRLVAEYASDVALLVDGKVVTTGPPAQLFDDPSLLSLGHLVPPPILALSRMIAQTDATFPPEATIDAFLTEVLRRQETPANLVAASPFTRLTSRDEEWR